MTGLRPVAASMGRGAAAALVGGLAFGAAMIELGMLTSVASLIQAEAPIIGFVVHMAVAALIGTGFGLTVCYHRPRTGETLYWGLIYGALWWFLGPLTLMPLWLTGELAWSIARAQGALPSLLGHLGFGVVTALAFVAISRDTDRASPRALRGPLVRGGVAGLSAAWLTGSALAAQGALSALSADSWLGVPGSGWALALIIGLLAGMGFALLHGRPREGSGVGIVRGALYGFVLWGVLPMTLLPILQGEGLAWTLTDARSAFPGLIGYLFLGALLGLVHHGLTTLARFLFGTNPADPHEEGLGTSALRALGRGAWAGILGGLAFTLVMLQTGVLPSVAGLVGASSGVAGFVVHLAIAILIGASYGLLFRGRSYDRGSALGWGLSYGFVWWVLGALTLMPVFLGVAPDWSAARAAELASSLVGHLAYGAALGLTYYAREARQEPWWMPRSEVEARRVRFRQAQVLTSAPALWTLLVVLALLLPLLLSPAAGSP